MIKTLVSSGVYTSGNVPMTLYRNTNDKYELNPDNSISIKTNGLTNIIANLVITAADTANLTLQLYADGVAIKGAAYTRSVDIGGIYTFNINDVVKTIYQGNSYSNIYLRFDGNCMIVSGDMICEYVR